MGAKEDRDRELVNWLEKRNKIMIKKSNNTNNIFSTFQVSTMTQI